MTSFAINDSYWSGQHSSLGTTCMQTGAQTPQGSGSKTRTNIYILPLLRIQVQDQSQSQNQTLRGRRKGLGMCPHSSCPCEMQLCMGNQRSVATPRIHLSPTYLLVARLKYSGETQNSAVICCTQSLATLKAWRKTISMTSFATNDSDWPGQHSVLGNTQMQESTQTLPPPAKGLALRLDQSQVHSQGNSSTYYMKLGVQISRSCRSKFYRLLDQWLGD